MVNVLGQTTTHASLLARLSAVEDPMTYRITVGYNGLCDIASVADKNGDAYGFEYHNGRLMRITDPSPFNAQQQVFAFYKIMFTNDQYCEYRDRRGELWHTKFNAVTGNKMEVEDPLGHLQNLNYDDWIVHPTMHEPLTYTDALDHTWEFDWDTAGNLLSTDDPTNRVTQYQYDELNNLTRITPPGESPTGSQNYQISYNLPALDPTAPTKVVIPPDGHGNPIAPVDLGYFGESTPKALGQLKSVTDANGSRTEYGYNTEGVLNKQVEKSSDPYTFRVNCSVAHRRDKAGRLLATAPMNSNFNEAPPDNGTPFDIGATPELYLCVLGPAIEQEVLCVGKIVCQCCVMVCNPHCRWTECDNSQTQSSTGGGETGVFDPYLPQTVCVSPHYNDSPTGAPTFGYDNSGRLTASDLVFSQYTSDEGLTEHSNVRYAAGYDDLGRLANQSIESDETSWFGLSGVPRPSLTRSFTYDYDDGSGMTVRTGPDGQITTTLTDVNGRLQHVERSSLSADYVYWPTGNLQSTQFGNGATTIHFYDDAQRLERIEHWNPFNTLLLSQDFTYTARGLIETSTESGPNGVEAVTTYVYDKRDQLISEHRLGTFAYCFEYQYDQGGNRTWKRKKDPAQPATVLEQTQYHYDVVQPKYYQSGNNRLMYYQVSNGNMQLLRTVYYVYRGDDANLGNPTAILHREAGSTLTTATQFAYNSSGEVWLIGKRQWLDSQSCTQVQTTDITEVRGSGRARYLYRKRQSNNMSLVDQSKPIVWSDYDGDVIYGDYTAAVVNNALQVQEKVAYLPGIGQAINAVPPAESAALYYHSDQIGSLRLATDGNGEVVGRFVYSAFGELIHSNGGIEGLPAPTTRYQYAGAFGYETLPDVPYLHVGHRWYDPSTGRFLQRDPIGIDGGMNTYLYIMNDPVNDIDPLGLWPPQYDEFRKYGHGRISSFLGTCMVYSAQVMGVEDLWDAGEGRDRFGNTLTTGQRIGRGVRGSAQLVGAGANATMGVRALCGPPAIPPLPPPSQVHLRIRIPKGEYWPAKGKGYIDIRYD